MGSAARKDVVIRLRVARDQKCVLFEAARRRGTTLSDFLRTRALCPIDTGPDDEMASRLKRPAGQMGG